MSKTSPKHGLTFLTCNVNVIIPVSFIPGKYSGCNVFKVDPFISPVPFSVQ